MSWPADGKPRFVVATTHGAIGPGYSSTGRPPGTSWLVLDRAKLHALVAEYRSEDNAPRFGGSGREERRAHWERTAREHAERLNADHEAAGAVADHAIQVTVSENAERLGNWAKGWRGNDEQDTVDLFDNPHAVDHG